MSKHAKLLAGAVLIAGLMAAPVGARAQHHHHGGGHRGGYHSGHHGGHYGGHYHGHHGGWGGITFGFGAPGFYYGAPYAPYYDDPYYYDEPPPPPPDCYWAQIRVWRYGRWVWRSVRRCD